MAQHDIGEPAGDEHTDDGSGDSAPAKGGQRGDLARLADTSDTLLSEIRRLREIEEKKRQTSISSPEFHELASEVEDRAKRVWRTAATELDEGNRLETMPGVSTNDAEEIERHGQ